MKNIRLLVASLALVIFSLSGCTPHQCNLTRTYLKYTPIYMSEAEFQSSIAPESAREMEMPRKIFFKDDYIFVNEYLKGVHIIDNSNPSNPVNVGFINIPGCSEMAVKGNILYSNSYTDLVAINVNTPSTAYETARLSNQFPYDYYMFGQYIDPDKGYVKDWDVETVVEEYMGNCDDIGINRPGTRWGGMPIGGQQEDVAFGGTATGDNGTFNKGENAVPGVAGSMAGFVVYDDYLYTIVEGTIKIFDISTVSSPSFVKDLYVGWGIETLFPYRDKMFIGSTSGMWIYDLTDPINPNYLGMLEHVTSCDPVVVEDETAYVTLRNGTPCFGFTNELQIIDVSTPTAPRLIATHDMHNPHGLGIDESTAFICDGDAGLKIFDVNNPNDIELIQEYKNINTYDAIPLSNKELLIMIGSDGLYQYDYSSLQNINLLSVISTK